jgi:signal transduction histidine kinase
MKGMERPRGYQGAYLIGFMMIGVVALRAFLFYRGQPNLGIVMLLIALYAMSYSTEPWLSNRFHWYKHAYFPFQTAVVITSSNMHPFLDFQTVLYFPLCIQIFRTFSRQGAMAWMIFFVTLLGLTLIPGMGLWEGLALILLHLASGAFLISYDFLYSWTQADQIESQRLLANLQSAHHRLQEHTAQAEELAAVRERNRLARELHDSVSQVIFSIALTSQSARLFLERDPARVSGEIERLQEMTSSALTQLRALIAQLRPH